MVRNRMLMVFGASVLIPALVLTGCGGKKKTESSSDSQPTQTSNAQATRPAGATAAPTTAASNSGGGGNVSGNDLAALLANFLKSKSYKMALQDGSGKSEGTFEYVAPNKYHIVSGDLELISIGADSYVKQAGTWIKVPAAAGAGAINTMDSLKSQLDAVSKLTATKGGSDSVNGVNCQIYNVTESDGTKSELCVANGLPIRIKSTNTIILISDYDKVSDIKAPI